MKNHYLYIVMYRDINYIDSIHLTPFLSINRELSTTEYKAIHNHYKNYFIERINGPYELNEIEYVQFL